MRRPELVSRICAEAEAELAPRSVDVTITALLKVIRKSLPEGPLHISGLGVFRIVTLKARTYHDMATGKMIERPAARQLRMKPSKTLLPPA